MSTEPNLIFTRNFPRGYEARGKNVEDPNFWAGDCVEIEKDRPWAVFSEMVNGEAKARAWAQANPEYQVFFQGAMEDPGNGFLYDARVPNGRVQ